MSSPARNFSSLLSPDQILFLLQTHRFLSLRKLHQIQGLIVTNPHFHTHTHLLSQFITSSTLCLDLSLPSLLLRRLPNPDPSLWAHFLRSCLTLPDAPNLGNSLHCQLLKMGLSSHLFIQTGLLDFYSKTGFLDSAEKLFAEMPDRDAVACNAMIAALSSHGRILDARKLFDAMPVKTSASWNSMITCYCKDNDVCAAREMFDRNPVKDVVSWNAMIDGYCKTGQLVIARELFDRMGSAKNSVTWNTMISGYLHHREFGTAISLFRKMQAENVKPTEVTMVSLLSACAHLGALNMGRWIHAYIRNHRLNVDAVLGNALLDMYFKCGSVETALEVFHWMPVKNVFCWNSVIAGLGMNGYGEEAVEVFIEMDRRRAVKPDWVTFVGLLSGCSHSGLVAEGKMYFSQMSMVYGIEPKVEHYGCMVDLLGRAGLLEEALHFVEAMPIQPNCVVWGSLLRACRIHRNAKVSEQVTKHLLELDPDDGGNYVFLSNIYASTNRWNDVENCRRIMIARGVRKIPGCSSIEVSGVVHEFVAGDTSHPQFEQINAFLVGITWDLRKLGYQPGIDSVLHDIEDEEKENAVMYHSEKIAIAFGLMSTSGKEPIRVVKNLRVCGDCHEATKLMAKLFQREIVVRDRNRFHHFRDGICSCKDYW